MVTFLIFPALSAVGTHFVTKAAEEKKAEERVDLVAALVGATPEQLQAVEAVKREPLDNLRARMDLGLGPFQPLPEGAAERAKEMRAQMQAKQEARLSEAKKVLEALPPEAKEAVLAEASKLTPEEIAELKRYPEGSAEYKKALQGIVTEKQIDIAEQIKQMPIAQPETPLTPEQVEELKKLASQYGVDPGFRVDMSAGSGISPKYVGGFSSLKGLLA